MPIEDVTWALKQVGERVQRYALYEAYYRGDHRLLFATEKFRNTFGPMFQTLRENLCPTVVQAVTDRLAVTGWDVPVEAQNLPEPGDGGDVAKPPPNPLAQIAQDIWDASKMGKREGEVYSKALRLGDAFVIVGQDPVSMGARFWPQRSSQMAVRYSEDSPDVIEVAAKCWKIDGKPIYRLTLYYPDHIERYVTKGNHPNGLPSSARAFVAYADERTPDGSAELKYGMPVLHFGNDAETGEYGVSLLHDVIPIQDMLNKELCDMLVAMEFTAFPQRWATGVQPMIDPDTGQEVAPFKIGVDRILTVGSDNAKFGQFDPASVQGYLDAQDKARASVARVTGTPPYLLGLQEGSASSSASGEARKTSDSRIVKRAKNLQRDWGDEWSSGMKVALAYEGKDFPVGMKPVWQDAETRNERDQAETLQIKVTALGVTKRQALVELGYDPDLIEQMLDEGEATAQDVQDLIDMQAGGGNVSSFAQAKMRQGVVPGQPVVPEVVVPGNGAQA